MLVYLMCNYLGIKANQTLEMDTGMAQDLIRRGVVKEIKGKKPKVIAKEVSEITKDRKDKMIRKIDLNTKEDVITD